MIQFRLVALTVVCLCCVLYGQPVTRADTTLDVRTMGDWIIVVAEDAIASKQTAAEEFQSYFEQATGHKLRIQNSARATFNVFIGPGKALKESRLGFVSEREYAPEELRIVVRPDNIVITGGRPRGVLYGVYEFLESALGIRFLTTDHTHVPPLVAGTGEQRKGILPTTDFVYGPPVECRLIYYTDVMGDPEFSARLRINSTAPGFITRLESRAEMVGGYVLSGEFLLVHSVGRWAEGIDRDADPTVMAIWRGKRINQPCMTHPEVMAVVTRNVVEAASRQPKDGLLRVVQEDAPWCECSRCQAV